MGKRDATTIPRRSFCLRPGKRLVRLETATPLPSLFGSRYWHDHHSSSRRVSSRSSGPVAFPFDLPICPGGPAERENGWHGVALLCVLVQRNRGYVGRVFRKLAGDCRSLPFLRSTAEFLEKCLEVQTHHS